MGKEGLSERDLVEQAWALPRDLAYWAAVRVMSEATVAEPQVEVPRLSAIDGLRLWAR